MKFYVLIAENNTVMPGTPSDKTEKNDSLMEDAYNLEDTRICSECYDNFARHCDKCGYAAYENSLYWDDITEAYYCSECYDDLINKRESEEDEENI